MGSLITALGLAFNQPFYKMRPIFGVDALHTIKIRKISHLKRKIQIREPMFFNEKDKVGYADSTYTKKNNRPIGKEENKCTHLKKH